MVKINISSFFSSVPTSVAVLMGRDHVELAMAKDEPSSAYSS